MRVSLVVLVILAVVAAGGAAFLARQAVQPGSGEDQPPATELAIKTHILIAALDLAPGARLQANALRWQPWPEEFVRSDLITLDLTLPDVQERRTALQDDFINRAVRRAVAAGEPLTRAMVFERGEGGFLPGLLGENMRAVAVPVRAETAVAGFVLPGNRIDILVALDLRRALPSGAEALAIEAGVVGNAAELVVENVRVLAVDQTLTPSREGEPLVSRTVTVEVSAEQAERLALAMQIGDITLALRSLGAESEAVSADGKALHTRPIVTDITLSRSLQRLYGIKQEAAERALEQEAQRQAAAAAAALAGQGGASPAGGPAWSVTIRRGTNAPETVSGN